MVPGRAHRIRWVAMSSNSEVSFPISGPLTVHALRELVGVAGCEPATPSSRRGHHDPKLSSHAPKWNFWEACARDFGLSSAPGLEPWDPRFVVLLSLVKLENLVVVTPDVTPSAF